MELSFYVVWNIFVTLVIAPLFYSIRKNENEAKRIDILVNKTREEIARDYVMNNMAIGIPGITPPTQSMAGPVATGQAYAQQIAGGMPMEQVIAPGVSYSPEMAGGYTQADLDLQNRFVGEGPAPILPSPPTKETPLTIEDQMPYAPPGVKEPTKFMPFLQDLDFSGLPRYEDIRDIRSFEDIRPTLFDIDLDVEEILKDIDTEKFEDIDIPSVAPVFPEVPVMPQTPVFTQPVIPSVEVPQVPVMPQVPVWFTSNASYTKHSSHA